jgi:Zn-dependent protease with chaperone function
MATGALGIFFDGETSVRRTVWVEIDSASLVIREVDIGEILARWPYSQIKQMSAPEGVMRLGRAGEGSFARLEIRDPAVADTIERLGSSIVAHRDSVGYARGKVVLWMITAAILLVAVGLFGVPALSDRLAPLIPSGLEGKLGAAIDAQVRSMLDAGRSGKPFDCGLVDVETPGRAAFDKLIRRLEMAAVLPIALRVTAVRRSEANAIALPGGHIYVFAGLIAKARSADELAGVIAHEMGHVAHRDGVRSVMRAVGVSFLFGMLLGDFVGGGAITVAARAFLHSSYSRDIEAAADLYAVNLIQKVGGDGRALGTLLARVASIEPGVKIPLDHRDTKERLAAIDAAAPTLATAPLLAPAEWVALKQICGAE